MTREADLYGPVKALLERRGYDVKAEVRGCDVVGVKADEPLVIVELKLSFSLDLILQGVDRQNMADDVYLAVPAPDTPRKRQNWRGRQKSCLKLCRKLGLGLMHVGAGPGGTGDVSILLDPKPYTPRKNALKKTRLMAEFEDRSGDPNIGGINKTKIMTAYRQNAFRCAVAMADKHPSKVSDIRKDSGVQKTAAILQKNHYGWFDRTARGIYSLTTLGQESLKQNADMLQALFNADTN